MLLWQSWAGWMALERQQSVGEVLMLDSCFVGHFEQARYMPRGLVEDVNGSLRGSSPYMTYAGV